MTNPERFPAGKNADSTRFNDWTSAVVDKVEGVNQQVTVRLARYDERAEMNSVQVTQNAVWYTASPTLPSGNRLRSRADFLGGVVQHDVRYGQLTQILSNVREYENQVVRISQPVAAGGEKNWVRSFSYQPAGALIAATTTATVRGFVRTQMASPRRVNCLVWEPYPSLTYDLIAVKVLTTSGETSLNLTASSGIETVLHGAQRFFFPEVEAWGAEVEVEGSAASGSIYLGCWKFKLARVSPAPGASTGVYSLSTSPIVGTVTVYGEGNHTVTTNTPSNGQVTITMTTPPTGPTSVIRRLEFST